MHGSRGCDACVNQCLRTLFTLNQDHSLGNDQSRLVEQGAGIGWSHLATLSVPWTEFLLAPGRVIAIDHCDQMTGGVKVIPLGCGWSQLVDRSFLFGFSGLGRHCLANQISRIVQHPRKVGLNVRTKVSCNQAKYIPTVTCGAISPESSFLTIKDNFQAVAGAAQDVTHQEFAAPLFTSRKQSAQH